MTRDKTFVVLRVYKAPGEPLVDVHLTVPVGLPELAGVQFGLEQLYAVTPDGATRRVLVKRMESGE